MFVNKYTEPETPTEPKTPTEESTPTTEPTVDTLTENSSTEPIEETESVDTGDTNPTVPLAIIGASALALMLTAIGVRKKYNK